jgi:hypothetical protein
VQTADYFLGQYDPQRVPELAHLKLNYGSTSKNVITNVITLNGFLQAAKFVEL